MTWPIPEFGKSDWQLVGTHKLASGFFNLDRLTISHRGYQCEKIGPMQREIFLRDPSIVVLLVDREDDTIVLVEQFRIGAATSCLDDSPWLLECVAGICDQSESPGDACIREVFEETGLQLIGNPHLLFTYYPSPGGSNELIHLFVGYCDSSKIISFCGQPREFEDIKVHVIPVESAIEALHSGKVNNGATIIGLQWLELQRQSTDKWRS